MKNQVNFLIKKALNLRISTKFILFYLVLLALSITLSYTLFHKTNSRILESKIGEASVQTLDAISSSFDLMFRNINNYSKSLLSNSDIQEYLLNENKYTDYVMRREITEILVGNLQAIPNISSIYLFDNNSILYGVDPNLHSARSLKIDTIQQASWYDEAVEKKGKYIIKVSAGGIFENEPDGNYISFIRIINNLQDNKPIGLMIINIPIVALKDTFQKTISGNDVNISAIYKGETVIDFENNAFKLEDIDNKLKNKDHKAQLLNLNKKPYLVTSVTYQESNWRFVSVIPFSNVKSEFNLLNFVALIIILLNSFLLFIGALFISKRITTPIKKILESMKMIEKGEIHQVQFASDNYEIGKLRDGYNIMVLEIRELIEKIIIEQKIKRKAELNVLQEQIKPHFLYNSLDAIAYMTLAGKGEDAYNVIIALSNYYRTCLSKGSEIVTIVEEVDIVRNYLIIQKVRFPNLFVDEYDIEDSVNDFKILKLILQPLVENALYHGIQPKGEGGKIIIRVRKEAHLLRISVEDDGVGMSEEACRKVMSSELQANLSSFGLRGTIERLKIFYGNDDIYNIWSEKGRGTIIKITIPMSIDV